MKIFLDSANIEEIKAAHHLIDGVTTNPSLMARENGKFEKIAREICALVAGPISLEVISTTVEGMIKEARTISKIHKNAVVKIPMGWDGLKAVRLLAKEGIKTNVTLVFSANQALLAAKAGATFVSPFVGRLDDLGHNGMEVVEEIISVLKRYRTQVIVASVRHPLHAKQAALIGAHIATVPFKVLEQMCQHPLTDAGIKRFLEDYQKAKNK